MAGTTGRRIQLLLDERGMTRKQFADSVGVTEAAISRYVSGDREPKAVTAAKIASVLNVSMDELYGTAPDDDSEINGAVRLVARNAQNISAEQKRHLIDSLMGLDY